METIITGFLLGLGLIGALFFVANIGWVLIAVACLAAIGAVLLFPGFFACIAILIIGGAFAPVVIERLKKIELPKRPPPAAPPPAPEPIVVPSTALTVYEGKDEPESEGWMFCLIGIAAVAFTALIIFCATSTPSTGPASAAPIAHHAHHHHRN
jgi:hypothetical protein